MSPTTTRLLAVLVCAGLVVGAGLTALIRRMGGDLPVLSWLPAFFLVVAAVGVGWTAWSTWRAVHRDKQRVNADRAVLHLSLALASSRVGAVLVGGFAGFALMFVEFFETSHGRDRVIHGAAAAVAAALLVAAGLALERACRLPSDDDDDDDGDPSPGSTPEATPA